MERKSFRGEQDSIRERVSGGVKLLWSFFKVRLDGGLKSPLGGGHKSPW